MQGSDAEDVLAVAARCDNRGRWGLADERGTLNHITPDTVVRAAGMVRSGEVVSLAKPLDVVPSSVNPRPAWHVMHLETERPYAAADGLHLQVHGLANTHLDALGHMYLEGIGYRPPAEDVVRMGGLRRSTWRRWRPGSSPGASCSTWRQPRAGLGSTPEQRWTARCWRRPPAGRGCRWIRGRADRPRRVGAP